MLRYVLIFTLLLFTGCMKERVIVNALTPATAPTQLNADTIVNIPIPVREQGYSNFETQLLTTQTELDGFLANVEQQGSWNQKKNFLESLLLKPIDFTLYNLLIYRITESSGSTVLSVDAPSGNAEKIVVVIGRDEPSMGTTDMAYYALAYKVAKSAKSITFDNGVKKDVIENKTLTSKITTNPASNQTAVPSECLEWFDGCNNCARVNNQSASACTEKFCENYGEFNCTKWKENAL